MVDVDMFVDIITNIGLDSEKGIGLVLVIALPIIYKIIKRKRKKGVKNDSCAK